MRTRAVFMENVKEQKRIFLTEKMDFLPCLPKFINPIEKTLYLINNQHRCTGNDTTLGPRNPTFKWQVPPLLALRPPTSHALNPNALVSEDL